ncbi:hypothetical protein XU18_0317 [Perkinsela sp. CCAP 1560/4]|nr:hypothetical protein XU18_0317 [Perkinsela sp. CCAP 1560/4]|eukprot:KNH09632.1 hypothetical protein XU18_0317 [Perkinsela sp. CCAP 1560/4]
MTFRLLGITIAALKFLSYEGSEQGHSGVHYMPHPSSYEVMRAPDYGEHRPVNMTIHDHTAHPDYFSEIPRNNRHHPAEYQNYMEDGQYAPCPHCGDPAVGDSGIGDGQMQSGETSMDELWRYDRSMCASPSECARISRFPSPPAHPFDPFCEMKIHAIECMLNSPSHYSSTGNSSGDESDETPYRQEDTSPTNYAEPTSFLPKHSREQWPSPPRGYTVHRKDSSRHEYTNQRKNTHRDEYPRASNSGIQSSHASTQHASNAHHHQLEFASEPSYHPGVGYFQLPDSFVQQFAL